MSIKPAEYGPYTLMKRFRHDEEHSRIPQKRSWKKSVLNFDEGTTFGRTPTNWFVLTCFFIVFYTCLVFFWLTNFIILTNNMDNFVPMHKTAQPGMSFAPAISTMAHPVIDYRQGMAEMIEPYIDAIDDFIHKFDEETNPPFGPCTVHNEYGYDALKPCIILKINRVIGFTPQTYDAHVPVDAPAELKAFINALPEQDRMNRIWLSCQSDQTPDRIEYNYYPNRFVMAKAVMFEQKTIIDKNKEFDNKFYDRKDFERMVAVQLSGIPQKVEVNFKCFMWAKNIIIEDMGVGMVAFTFRVFPI